ncbi:arginine deiminase-related protein [Sporomusa aerivorans]|uniref:arginine deiminase-related protein n=1 Tax=Sporomusa aerivorans TaxID=204936 RepID=UPI00352BA28D
MEHSFVTSSTGKLEKVLLCPPVNISLEPIDYISNRWAAAGAQANRDACLKEHASLVQAYRANGVEVIMAEPAAGLTNQVYSRDFGACIKEGYILGNFREPVRQGESHCYLLPAGNGEVADSLHSPLYRRLF